MEFLGDFFNVVLIEPLTNLFVLLVALTGNAGIAVILLTLIIQVLVLPLRLRQMHSMRAMALLAPSIQELQKRYKDPRRRSEEQMKLYREAGINPLGCFSSMLLQFPIIAALSITFRVSLGDAPEAVISLAERLYAWDYLRVAVPLPTHFLWMNLGQPDPLVLPVLSGASTYIVQKMTMIPTTDEKQRAQASTMNLLFPLMSGYFTLLFPSGLGLYWVLSNFIGIAVQYAYVGGGPFNWKALLGLSSEPVLPRALEVRQKQQDRFKQLGQDEQAPPAVSSRADGDEPTNEKPRTNGRKQAQKGSQPATDGAAARRRRYSSGRRRGRR